MTDSLSTMKRFIPLTLLLGLAACTSVGTKTAGTAAAARTTTDVEVTNATNFHVLDFVAWNNQDLDVFRHLHTSDVKVNYAGYKTEGIDAHVQALTPALQSGVAITHHAPIIAEGDWTCVVGVVTGGKSVTVAKWHGGAISEEYILSTLLPPGTAKPAVSGAPMVSIRNRNPALKRVTGAEPGWSCMLEHTADGKMVISLNKADGTAAQQMVFAQ